MSARADGLYRLLFEALLSRMPVELAHATAVRSVRALTALPGTRGLLARRNAPDPILAVRALGLDLSTPLGVAAGLDKEASWFEQLGLLGFGHVEVGTVTALAQPGNPAPRIVRLPRDRALWNRMGFPNPGAATVAERLRGRPAGPIVGANIGRSRAVEPALAAADHRASVRALAGTCDYLVVNVSSPNTPGLRAMQAVELLRPLLEAVREEQAAIGSEAPLLVKIAPDLVDSQIDEIVELALELSLAGIVAVNTTEQREGLLDARRIGTLEGGGVSGAPLRARSVRVLERLRARAGDRLVLVSVGGVQDAEDVWQRVLAGASLVQAYTGFVYGGPAWPTRVNRELAARVRRRGAASIAELVGAGA